MRGQRRTARQTPPEARPNRGTLARPASFPGRSLEAWWRHQVQRNDCHAFGRTEPGLQADSFISSITRSVIPGFPLRAGEAREVCGVALAISGEGRASPGSGSLCPGGALPRRWPGKACPLRRKGALRVILNGHGSRFQGCSCRHPGAGRDPVSKGVRSTRHSLAASPDSPDDQPFGCCKVLPVCAGQRPEACTHRHSPLASRPSSRHSGKRVRPVSSCGPAFSSLVSGIATRILSAPSMALALGGLMRFPG